MSCNGCRVLRKGCSETCVLRSCLRWIDSPESQGNATLFLAKFFGRSDLLSFISAVPENQRPALFQSLLFEACGRTVNPVSGAVGLLSSGNWHVCHASVQSVLSGGVLRPLPPAMLTPNLEESQVTINRNSCGIQNFHYASLPSMLYHEVDRSQPLDVGLSLKPNLAAAGGRGRARGWSCTVDRMRDTVSFNSEDSIMTTSGGGGNSTGDHKLLNLFV
ncbi:LOB domain-containing protein 37-like [Argentina anserina]|uniref:LOB domain-containing protein 37-like n=1 Tax=Argentina anserina TaxID=57926 RepID=UPI00217643FD|nr:LOB domain-containing protein 37-like [Potentilla anserina]